MKMKKLAAWILALSMCAMLLAACGGSPSSGAAAGGAPSGSTPSGSAADAADSTAAPADGGRTMGGDYVRGCAQAIGEFFSPYKQGTMREYGWPCYEPSAYFKADQQWHACLAESWEVDNDNFTLTIQLKEGITFHNGDPLDAQDLVFTLEARNEYGTGSVIGSPVKVEALDDYTVRVTWDYFSLNYETWVLGEPIYSKETFDEKGLDWMLNNMVGTGPYRFDEYIPDVHLKFVRNEDYWGDRKPGPDTMTWLYMPDETTQLAAFMNGEIDLILPIGLSIVDQLEAAGYEGAESAFPVEGQYFAVPISVNPDDPLSNADVRKAIFEHGIDWDTLAATLGGSTGYHTDCIGLPAMTYYKEDLEQSSYDPDLAKQELANAGYPNGFDTTIISGAGRTEQLATVLQAELAKIGIQAEVENVDGSIIQAEYMSAKSADSGIVLAALAYPSSNQTDRFGKHVNPNGSYGGSSDWTDEIKELWNKVPSARTMDEQNQFLYDYVKYYVHEGCYMWPAYNTKNVTFYQEWCHHSEMAEGGGAGCDPFEIWLDPH